MSVAGDIHMVSPAERCGGANIQSKRAEPIMQITSLGKTVPRVVYWQLPQPSGRLRALIDLVRETAIDGRNTPEFRVRKWRDHSP